MWHIDNWGKIVDESGQDVMMRSVSNLCSGSDDAVARAEKNTVLAAAAPALLEALEDLYNQDCGRYDLKSCGHLFVCVCPGDKAKAAIAAAKGE